MSIGVTFGTLIGILIVVIWFFLSFEKRFYLFVTMTAFTRLSFVNVSGNSILLYQVLGMLIFLEFLIKYGARIFRKNRVPRGMIIFGLYSFVSIFFALFCSDAYVLNVDSKYGYVKFGFQQFTQFAYLLFAITFMYITYILLCANMINIVQLEKTFEIQFMMVCILGLVQMFIDPEVFDLLFRNALVTNANQTVNGLYRIASVFGEASMLALYLTPFVCYYLYRATKLHNSVKYIVLSILGGGIIIENNASSAAVGIAAFIVALVIKDIALAFLRKKRIHKRTLQIGAILIVIAIVLCFVFRDNLAHWINNLSSKLAAENYSGKERTSIASLHWRAFLLHPIGGVGFGTLRGSDLLTGWLAELGIVGFAIYVAVVTKLCVRLFSYADSMRQGIGLTIISYNAIMMVAVPEYGYMFVWFFYAIGYYLLQEKTTVVNTEYTNL